MDDKISLDELQQQIEGDEEHVQSTDVSQNPILPHNHQRAHYIGVILDCCHAEVVDGTGTKKANTHLGRSSLEFGRVRKVSFIEA